MKNLEIYNKLKSVPKEYLKTIQAGRLKGMTDIKPQWRIMAITEQFGACGFGWYYDNVSFEYKQGANEEIICNCRLSLYVKIDNEWSKPIFGTGGSKLVAKESNGMHNSDEAEKMAMTDALSVAMKALGVAGDIYLGIDNTKYNNESKNEPNTELNWLNKGTEQFDKVKVALKDGKATMEDVRKKFKVSKEVENLLNQ
jgi:hypothetical protein